MPASANFTPSRCATTDLRASTSSIERIPFSASSSITEYEKDATSSSLLVFVFARRCVYSSPRASSVRSSFHDSRPGTSIAIGRSFLRRPHSDCRLEVRAQLVVLRMRRDELLEQRDCLVRVADREVEGRERVRRRLDVRVPLAQRLQLADRAQSLLLRREREREVVLRLPVVRVEALRPLERRRRLRVVAPQEEREPEPRLELRLFRRERGRGA